jgi:hypothetical protein
MIKVENQRQLLTTTAADLLIDGADASLMHV